MSNDSDKVAGVVADTWPWVARPKVEGISYTPGFETNTPNTIKGIKLDGEKPRTDLLDADFMLGVSRVLTFGAKKYSAHNWRGGITYSRLISAILRHTFAILLGEDIDEETGELHTAHLGCEVMFLHWMLLHRKDMDDRWKK